MDNQASDISESQPEEASPNNKSSSEDEESPSLPPIDPQISDNDECVDEQNPNPEKSSDENEQPSPPETNEYIEPSIDEEEKEKQEPQDEKIESQQDEKSKDENEDAQENSVNSPTSEESPVKDAPELPDEPEVKEIKPSEDNEEDAAKSQDQEEEVKLKDRTDVPSPKLDAIQPESPIKGGPTPGGPTPGGPEEEQKLPSEHIAALASTANPIAMGLFWEMKKINLITIKVWEDERYIQLRRWKTLLENVHQRLVSKGTLGKDTNELIVKYLKEASYSDVVYANLLKSQAMFLPHITSEKNSKTLKGGLAMVCEFQTDLAAQIKAFGHQTERELLKEKFQDMVTKYTEQITHISWRLDQIRVQIDDNSEVCMKWYKEHLVNFHDSEVMTSSGVTIDKDLWLSERNYLMTAKKSIALIRSYARDIVDAWDDIIQFEQMRLDITKETMLSFMKAKSEIFSGFPGVFEAYASVDEIVPDPMLTMATDQIIIENEVKVLKDETGLSNIPQALVAWPFPPAPVSSLIHKDGILWNYSKKQWKKGYIVITHDAFMHVLTSKDDTANLLKSITLKDAKVLEQYHMEEPIVEIRQAKSAGLFKFLSKTKRIKLRFDDEDAKKEWINYFIH